MAAEQPSSANEYILHHLTFLQNKNPQGIVDWSVIHWDSVFFSVLLAVLFGGSFYLAARNAQKNKGVPGELQLGVKAKKWFSATAANQDAAITRLTVTVGGQCFTQW